MEYRNNDFGLISYYSYGDMVYEYKYDDYSVGIAASSYSSTVSSVVRFASGF